MIPTSPNKGPPLTSQEALNRALDGNKVNKNAQAKVSNKTPDRVAAKMKMEQAKILEKALRSPSNSPKEKNANTNVNNNVSSQVFVPKSLRENLKDSFSSLCSTISNAYKRCMPNKGVDKGSEASKIDSPYKFEGNRNATKNANDKDLLNFLGADEEDLINAKKSEEKSPLNFKPETNSSNTVSKDAMLKNVKENRDYSGFNDLKPDQKKELIIDLICISNKPGNEKILEDLLDLNHPVGSQLQVYCEKSHCEENINFLRDFKNNTPIRDLQKEYGDKLNLRNPIELKKFKDPATSDDDLKLTMHKAYDFVLKDLFVLDLPHTIR